MYTNDSTDSYPFRNPARLASKSVFDRLFTVPAKRALFHKTRGLRCVGIRVRSNIVTVGV